jgi:hypothetical protein
MLDFSMPHTSYVGKRKSFLGRAIFENFIYKNPDAVKAAQIIRKFLF